MITLIAAIGENNELAKGDQMLWSLPDDYNRFKAITLHHPVVMGRRSVDTMPDILAERTAFAITRSQDYQRDGVIVAHSLEEAIEKAKALDEQVFIIGGGQIYHIGIVFGDEMELTRVHGSFPDANVFFPKFSEEDWELTAVTRHEKDERHAYSFTYEKWRRRKKS